MGNLFCGMRFHTKFTESRLDSVISQNLAVKNNSVRSTQTRPIRGAKNRIQGRSSASADFLLEAEKRGSPPKSEKRQLLGTHFKKVGGSGVGGATLLREESGESKSKKIANNSQIAKIDSSLTAFAQNDEFFMDCHDSAIAESRNDESMHDSPLLNLAMTRTCVDCFSNESPRNDGFFDSTNHTRNNRFILTRSKF